MSERIKQHAWVVSADMGYGHDRAAHALEELAYGEFITSNNYKGIPASDKKLWRETRELYEALSRLKPIPILGHLLFEAMDRFQEIPKFYPRRDLSKPSLQLRTAYRFLKRGLLKHLTETLQEKRRLPAICTFPLSAIALEYHGYPEDIYTLVTDTDMARAWVPKDPKRSKINYLAPTGRVVERLKLYGVRTEKIFHTGFPIPKRIIGGTDSPILKPDLHQRICNLDPNGVFTKRYWRTLQAELGAKVCAVKRKPRPVTITFAVGGAGAQRAIGIKVAKALAKKIKTKELRLTLVAGTHKNVQNYFLKGLKDAGLKSEIGKGVSVYYEPERHKYFNGFDQVLRKTDILWTKPSELSFYTGAGIPIIMAPPVGSQEEFNKLWLQNIGGGIPMHEPETANEWLIDWINSGALARMAWSGYIEAPTHGAYRIDHIIAGEEFKDLEVLPLVV
ncbi:hypothetical protein GF380_01265 [Candidatus Uhrbacteria bacterium]|nr:hypothetical protein [Candidatus Uhrbacteria bacterium]MBD3283914.1 hypothetical protein [Candidatus Uhrbacteria bacterium]